MNNQVTLTAKLKLKNLTVDDINALTNTINNYTAALNYTAQNVANQSNSFLTFITSLFISGFILFGISFIFYLLVFSSSIILTIIDSDISYIMDYISSIYSNNISLIYSIIFFICFLKNYRKSNKSKKWVRTLHYLGYIANNKVKTVYNIDEISKFYINGNTICFSYGTKTIQMLTQNKAVKPLALAMGI